jgi:hypothetical protein
MVFFVIGVPKIQGNAKTSIDRVNTSIAKYGALHNVNLETVR